MGNFIRQRREALGLSQRALGQLFDPPVTTQFISNVERGVTPLPPTHVATLSKALVITETEILEILEKEYVAKLSGRLGVSDVKVDGSAHPHLVVGSEDYDLMRKLYDAYRRANEENKRAFITVCESMLGMVKPKPDNDGSDRSGQTPL